MRIILKCCSFLLVMLIVGCKPIYLIKNINSIEVIEFDFCELTNYPKNELVKINAIYSGIDEYWSLYIKESCLLNHKVYLNFNSNLEEWEKTSIFKVLDKLEEEDLKYEAHLEIVGIIERDSVSGFGHLGGCEYQILPESIKVKRIKKIM